MKAFWLILTLAATMSIAGCGGGGGGGTTGGNNSGGNDGGTNPPKPSKPVIHAQATAEAMQLSNPMAALATMVDGAYQVVKSVKLTKADFTIDCPNPPPEPGTRLYIITYNGNASDEFEQINFQNVCAYWIVYHNSLYQVADGFGIQEWGTDATKVSSDKLIVDQP